MDGATADMVTRGDRGYPDAGRTKYCTREGVADVVPAEVHRGHDGDGEEEPERPLHHTWQTQKVRHDADGHHDPDVQRRECGDGLHGMGGERVGEHLLPIGKHAGTEAADG